MARVKFVSAAVILHVKLARKKRRRNRIIWVRDWIKNRPARGAYHQLLKELQLGDEISYRHFLRMDVASFNSLLSIISPKITKRDTHLRKAIPAGERLALTL